MVSKGKAVENIQKAVQDLVKEVKLEAEQEHYGDARPGTIVDKGLLTERKVPYTQSALERIYPMVEFTPEETKPVIVNGVRYNLFADQPCKVPSIIKDVYDASRRAARANSGITVSNQMGAVKADLGAGALEPEQVVQK